MNKKLLAFLLLSSLLISSCNDKISDIPTAEKPPVVQKGDSAFFSFYNFVTSNSTVQTKLDVMINGKLFYEALPFQGGIITKPVKFENDKNNVTIAFLNNQNKQTLYSTQKNLVKDHKYIGFVIGNTNAQSLEFLPDFVMAENNFAPFFSGAARVRILHAASNVGDIDIYVGGTKGQNKRASSVKYGTLTDLIEFVPVTNGQDTLVVVRAGSAPNPANDLYRLVSASPFFTINRNHLMFFSNQTPQATSKTVVLISRVN